MSPFKKNPKSLHSLSANTEAKMKHQIAVWSLRPQFDKMLLFHDSTTLLHIYSHPHSLCWSGVAVCRAK